MYRPASGEFVRVEFQQVALILPARKIGRIDDDTQELGDCLDGGWPDDERRRTEVLQDEEGWNGDDYGDEERKDGDGNGERNECERKDGERDGLGDGDPHGSDGRGHGDRDAGRHLDVFGNDDEELQWNRDAERHNHGTPGRIALRINYRDSEDEELRARRIVIARWSACIRTNRRRLQISPLRGTMKLSRSGRDDRVDG